MVNLSADTSLGTAQKSRKLGNALHPQVVAMVRELALIDGQLALNEERFEFWVKYLWLRFPRADHSSLYKQLGTMAFRLSRHGCRGALQLFALATLGLDISEARGYAQDDGFLERKGMGQRRLAEDIAQSTRPLPAPGSALPVPVVGQRAAGIRRPGGSSRSLE